MTYYEARYSTYTITPIEVEKETDQSIWSNGRQYRKINTYGGYFKTRDDAKQSIINHYAGIVKQIKSQLRYYEEELSKAQKL
jgi:hypothetical protein